MILKNLFKTLMFICVVCAVGCIQSCATFEKMPSSDSVDETQAAPDFPLGPNDTVRIIVEQHPEWSGEYTVRSDGNIYIQNIGEITFGGLSKFGAEIVLGEALGKYINNPKVTIAVVRYASQFIYVLGEVNLPGRYSTEGIDVTVRDAVVMAGLPSHFAATDRVYIISPAQKRPRQQVVNLDRILYRGELKRNIRIYPGDVIYIPKTIWGHISDFFSMILSPLQTVPAARAAALPTAVQ